MTITINVTHIILFILSYILTILITYLAVKMHALAELSLKQEQLNILRAWISNYLNDLPYDTIESARTELAEIIINNSNNDYEVIKHWYKLFFET